LFNNSYYYYNLHLQGTKIYKHRIFTTVEYLFSGTRVPDGSPTGDLDIRPLLSKLNHFACVFQFANVPGIAYSVRF